MSAFDLGAISFNTGTPDADGIVWYGYVDGWDETANRIEDVQRPAQHGAIIVSNLYEPREMTVFGTAVGENSTDYYTAKRKIRAETNVLTQFAAVPLVLSVVEDFTLRMEVLRTSLRSKCIKTTHMQFEMTIRADDPFKYNAVAKTLTTTGVAANAGNIVTYPTFTLTSAGAPTLTLGAQTVVANASLPIGTVIDFERMTVLNGATNYFGNMSLASQWFGLEPGNNSVSSTVAGTWGWRDAWL